MDETTENESIGTTIGYTGIIKYSVLIVLYFFTFVYIFNTSSQFLFYICVFILNFFLVAFILNDIYSNKSIMSALTKKNASLMARLALYAIILGGVGQFTSLIISLIVFGYATNQVKEAKKYFVINDFKDILFHFKTTVAIATFFIGLTDDSILLNISFLVFNVFKYSNNPFPLF